MASQKFDLDVTLAVICKIWFLRKVIPAVEMSGGRVYPPDTTRTRYNFGGELAERTAFGARQSALPLESGPTLFIVAMARSVNQG